LPSLHNAYEKVKESGLQILLIDIRESHSAVQRVVKKRGYTLQVLLDRDGAVTKNYAVWATPTVYLIDPKGYLIAQAVGPRDWNGVEGSRILKSLGE